MPHFKPNWLAWEVERENRTFRIHVVEPRAYAPASHASIFQAALQSFLASPSSEYRGGSNSPAGSTALELFDLLTFPEAFLPSKSLLTVLRVTSESGVRIGCVHTGLRPSRSSDIHLFSTEELRDLTDSLKNIPKLHRDDLSPFLAWLAEQQLGHHFNVGCLFTNDVEGRLRICLHPKFVRSKFEQHVAIEQDMTEANLLSLVTLVPSNRNLSKVTIQPLLCSDVLGSGTDSANNNPVEAVASARECFSEQHSQRVDIVSVPTCSPNPSNPNSDTVELEWHHDFRESFRRAASKDRCRWHHNALFVLSNFRHATSAPIERWGGLSGVFVPLPIHAELYPQGISKRKAVYARLSTAGPDEESERWVSSDTYYQHQNANHQAKPIVLGYLVCIDPNCLPEGAVASMFGFTLRRLPSDANRWDRTANVSRYSFQEATVAAHSDERLPVFRQRSNS